MEEKKDKSDDPVVDLFPDDDADDRSGKTRGDPYILVYLHHTLDLLYSCSLMLTHIVLNIVYAFTSCLLKLYLLHVNKLSGKGLPQFVIASNKKV